MTHDLVHRAVLCVAASLLGAAGAASMAASPSTAASADLVARGAYLANAGDCIACHTAKGGPPLAGGLIMQTPFGSIATPNITPDKATGIGGMTDEQFYKVMHEGIGRHGEYLYPAMPFPWYASVTHEDVTAIKAFLDAQPAVNKPRLPNHLRFPVNIRESMLAWREAFFKPQTFADDPGQTVEVNRGAYLVNGLAHCGECHNARPVAGVSRFKESLQGGVIDNWYAPNITSDVHDGIGAWTNAEIATYLKTGVAPNKGIALGPMAETVHSLSKLTDADLLAIAAYLKTTPPKATDKDQKLALFKGHDAVGGDTYLNFCASCHGLNGQGLPGAIPALANNGAVIAKGPQNVINVVLGGLQAREKYAPMPAIGAGMSDQDIADVTNYVRQTWANAAPATAEAGMVAKLRGAIDSPMLVNAKSTCASIQPDALATALVKDTGGMRTQIASMTEANMPMVADQVVAHAKAAAPAAKQADLVNSLTAAYCDVVKGDTSIDANQKALRLGNFSELLYTAAQGHPLVARK